MKFDVVKNEPKQIELKAYNSSENKKALMDEIEIISKNKETISSRVIPVKLSPKDVKRAYEYQKTMLNFAYCQYKKNIGTNKEESMRKLFKEAMEDYNFFVSEYKEYL